MFYIIEKDNSVKALDLKKEEDADVLREFIKEGRPYALIQWNGRIDEIVRDRRSFFIRLCPAVQKDAVGEWRESEYRTLYFGDFIEFYINGVQRKPNDIRIKPITADLHKGKVAVFTSIFDYALVRYYGDGIDGHATGDVRCLFSRMVDKSKEPLSPDASKEWLAMMLESSARLEPILESDKDVMGWLRNSVEKVEQVVYELHNIQLPEVKESNVLRDLEADRLDEFMYGICKDNKCVAVTYHQSGCRRTYCFAPDKYTIDRYGTSIEIPIGTAYIIVEENRLDGVHNGKLTLGLEYIKEVRIISEEAYTNVVKFTEELFSHVNPIWAERDKHLHEANRLHKEAEDIWNEHNKIDFELV